MSPGPGRAPGPGLYVHVPFCARVCPYCDFAVTTGDGAARLRFVELLEREAALAAPLFPAEGFDTLYLGGGTPSALDPPLLERLLAALRRELPLAGELRLFLEANPEDASRERLQAWRELGVSTLSLGVQALDDAALRLLGRAHRAEQARRAVGDALETGFASVSLDLIYARPEQSAAGWAAELEQAAALGPHHLSCYELTFHAGTPFERRRRSGALKAPGEPLRADLFRLTHERLASLGYEGYEVSNFARAPAHRSAHNRKYWRRVPYLGLGPSAHSFDGRRRFWNHPGLAQWAACVERGESAEAGGEELGPQQRALEALMLGLRTREGVDLEQLGCELGEDLVAFNAATLRALEAEGLARLEAGRLLPTLSGLAVADSLATAIALEGKGKT